ncbi:MULTISPECIES: peptidase [unclassified Ensifer]|uniref:carboxylesterase family protein n=1 Tax=unclassified Ensifer TaxID=2633371 RepID=UPI00081351EF|nr:MULTISPECIES: peptidase [unclassified Ensifer]OCP20541.1 peptidase [Ensifer sp. LC384]OCP20586.1 peptidase [Ensifer sp. LC54]
MHFRRDFLIMGAGTGALLAVGVSAFAQDGGNHTKSAIAVTKVFGEGVKLIAVAIEYEASVDGASLSADSFSVEGRTVTEVFASTTADPADRADEGPFVIVVLSAEDANAALAQKSGEPGSSGGGPGGRGGPGHAGDVPVHDTTYPPASATVVQSGLVTLADGQVIDGGDRAVETANVENLVVDNFQQLEFNDTKTGKHLRYNLFVPKDYDPAQRYPLVLFMHDAGATSDMTRTTLFQGLGAISWAGPEDQAERPAFVLAPQFAEIIADDDSRTSDALDATINLINRLTGEYSIDTTRLYTTGQSGGCMMSIAMDIKYPDFFAASFLVAGQWDPTLVKPLAKQKLWILVSQDDAKAFPGQNAITGVLEAEGAKISRATWDARWSAEEFRVAFDEIDAEASPINYVTFAPGTVIPEGESTAGASGHRNTWRVAYTIEPIRAWIFRQRR